MMALASIISRMSSRMKHPAKRTGHLPWTMFQKNAREDNYDQGKACFSSKGKLHGFTI
jgi:hypothetical protein